MPNASRGAYISVTESRKEPGWCENSVSDLVRLIVSNRRVKTVCRYLSSREHLLVIACSVLVGFLLHMVVSGLASRWMVKLGGSILDWRGAVFTKYKNESSGDNEREASGLSEGGRTGLQRTGSAIATSATATLGVESGVGESDACAPKHIAVIMDGNRRFGRAKHNDPLQGHWAGGQTLVDFIKWCMEDGLEVATLFAFSSENWTRDPLEINALMAIFAKYAEQLTTEALARNVRVHVLSTDLDRLPTSVRDSVNRLVLATASCSAFTVNICLSYGARDEILGACGRLATQASRGQLAPGAITADGSVVVSEDLFRTQLCSAHSTDPDLLIRTSGECRLSNFLLWQLAYTELFFIDKFWPEMTQSDLRDILTQYKQRNRRFGG